MTVNGFELVITRYKHGDCVVEMWINRVYVSWFKSEPAQLEDMTTGLVASLYALDYQVLRDISPFFLRLRVDVAPVRLNRRLSSGYVQEG